MPRRLLLLPLLLVLVACRSFRVMPHERIAQELERGDTVRVTEHDESWTRFRVTEVRSDAVLGEGVHVALSNVSTLERLESFDLRGLGGVVELCIAVLAVSSAISGVSAN